MNLDYDKAFIDSREVVNEDETVTFKIRHIADLTLPTGAIVACDPFVFYDDSAFTTRVSPGTYPVILSLADFGGHQRVAYAKLKITDQPAIRWELAVKPEQDVKSLKEGEFFGYGVDAGTGCFMDSETAKVYAEKTNEKDSETMLLEMQKNHVHNWSWGNFDFEGTNGNLIAFDSGWGDGVYGCYFGYDTNGEITALVTDFAVTEDLEVYSVN